VQLASPLPNASYLDGVMVNIQALVSNAGPDINRVEVTVDDTMIAMLPTPNEAGAPAFSITETWPADSAGTHTIMVIAFREDGTASQPASVTISVVDQVNAPQNVNNGGSTQTDAPTSAPSDSQPTATQPEPTDPPAPTEPPEPTASPTPSVPIATFTTGVNVRRGPDTLFVPPIGSFAANDQSEVLAVNPERTWYKVKYFNAEGWVFGNLLTVSGNADNLPVDAGPPKPTLTPVPPTAVPVTATPNLNINLVVGNITTDPDRKVCGETFRIFVDIANFGSSKSPGGSIRVEDSARGQIVETTNGAFGEIEPGQTINVGPIPLTVSSYYNEGHTLTIIVDPNNQIAETDENDNRNSRDYELRRGSC
jgi:hypothetical protein